MSLTTFWDTVPDRIKVKDWFKVLVQCTTKQELINFKEDLEKSQENMDLREYVQAWETAEQVLIILEGVGF